MYSQGGSTYPDVSKITAYRRDKKKGWPPNVPNEIQGKKCKSCGQVGHGRNPDFEVKRDNCPAFNNKCPGTGHYTNLCYSKEFKAESVAIKHEVHNAELQINFVTV